VVSTRQQIVDYLAGRLLLIQPGTQFDFPDGPYVCQSTIQKVKPWRRNPYSLGELPAVAYRDGLTGIFPAETGRPSRCSMRVIFAAYCTGNTPAGLARQILADMAAAVGSSRRCGGLAHQMQMNGASLALLLQGDVIAGVRLDLSIIFTPALGDPLTVDGEVLTMGGDTIEW
jgi:hypothetical protein